MTAPDARHAGKRQVEADGATVRCEQAEVVASAASAVDQTKARPSSGHVGQDGCNEAAKPFEPEVVGLGLTRQFESMIHQRLRVPDDRPGVDVVLLAAALEFDAVLATAAGVTEAAPAWAA